MPRAMWKECCLSELYAVPVPRDPIWALISRAPAASTHCPSPLFDSWVSVVVVGDGGSLSLSLHLELAYLFGLCT